jgi:hypothetical protein
MQAHTSLPPESRADLLQLAFNCSCLMTAERALMCVPDTEEEAADDTPGLQDPAVALRLLLTAATRQHAAVVSVLLDTRYPYQQLVDAGTLKAVLMQSSHSRRSPPLS